MSPVRVLKTIRRIEYIELFALFFIHAMALGMWLVPLGAVLDANGFQQIKALAFAASGLAAVVSPLVFGAMADRHASPVAVLRGLALATAVAMVLAATAIKLRWNPWLVLALIQLHALCSAPTWSLSNTIVLSRLRSSQREFGPIRSMATIGWAVGCWLVSAMNADTSPLAGFGAAVIWLVLSGFTFVLPSVTPPKSVENLTLRQRMGWDALALLKNHDHRVVFITAALFTIPLAALLPFSPPHLRELGLHHTTAWMSLMQITEVMALWAMAFLFARWRLKWIFVLGLSLGLLRYIFCALNGKVWLLLGIALHGGAFTLVIVTAQIYLEERVESTWRARAQALMTLMTTGLGNLIGYLGTGGWFNLCTGPNGTQWTLFWGSLAGVVAAVLLYFLTAYRGRSGRPNVIS